MPHKGNELDDLVIKFLEYARQHGVDEGTRLEWERRLREMERKSGEQGIALAEIRAQVGAMSDRLDKLERWQEKVGDGAEARGATRNQIDTIWKIALAVATAIAIAAAVYAVTQGGG